MPWNTGISGPHLDIAGYIGTPLRVMAGPGTGKTFAMMRRIARLLEAGVAPSSILAVTFTRTAANDLVDQLNRLGAPGANDVRASTLHAVSFSMLSKNAVFASTNRVARPLLQFENDCLVQDLAEQYGGKTQTRDYIAGFETAWATLQHQTPGWPQDPAQQNFHRDLMLWLTSHSSMLIGELVPLALDYIQRNPASPEASSFAHVLVDEYQDLNRADQELVDCLSRNGSLTVIGDEDQSIYTMLRYSHPDGIVNFHASHANTHDEALSECRRCPHRVIDMANALILHNHPPRPSTIQPMAQNGQGTVYVVQHDDIDQEVNLTAAYIQHYLAQNPGVNRGEVLILATRRLIGNRIRDALNAANCPAQSFFTEDSLAKMSAQRGICLLKLLSHPDDRASLRAWLGIDTANRRSGPYSRAVTAAQALGLSVGEYLADVDAGRRQPHSQSTGIMARYHELVSTLQILAGLTGTILVDQLWPVGDPDCSDVRAFALALILTTPTISNEELLDGLIEVITQPELPGVDDEIIRIMSLQKSKGLTAKCVVIVGCMAGALPMLRADYSPAMATQAYEEQRRLFYVALTRITETLVISSAATGLFQDVVTMGIPTSRSVNGYCAIRSSPYISELGASSPQVVSGNQWRGTLGF